MSRLGSFLDTWRPHDSFKTKIFTRHLSRCDPIYEGAAKFVVFFNLPTVDRTQS